MKKTKEHKTYAELKHELDQLLLSMQSDELDIDDAIAAHTRGSELIKQLEQHLKIAENTVVTVTSHLGKKVKT